MHTEHLIVSGMSCGGCVSRVKEALEVTPGIIGVEITLSNGKVDVSYDERLARPAQITAAVERAGYSVGSTSADVSSEAKGCCC